MDIEVEDIVMSPSDHTRAAQIKKLDIGESVSYARRVELKYGFSEGAISLHTRQVRGNIDQQAHRARRQDPHRKYKVENGSFMTMEGALILVAVVTRTE